MTKYLGEPADFVRDKDLKWAAFISHHQADASFQVLWLGERIEKELKQQGKRPTETWIDKKQKATEEGMHEGVRRSHHFILFLTKDVLTREFCLKEIRLALKYRKNVILVFQTDARCGGVPGPFFDYYGPELKKAFPNADDYGWLMRNSYVQFQDRGSLVDVMLSDPQCRNGILDQMSQDHATTHSAEVRTPRCADVHSAQCNPQQLAKLHQASNLDNTPDVGLHYACSTTACAVHHCMHWARCRCIGTGRTRCSLIETGLTPCTVMWRIRLHCTGTGRVFGLALGAIYNLLRAASPPLHSGWMHRHRD